MSEILHCCIDVGGLLSRGNRALKPYLAIITKPGGERFATCDELRAALLGEHAKGRLVIPVGEACEGFDYIKGCPGHAASSMTPAPRPRGTERP